MKKTNILVIIFFLTFSIVHAQSYLYLSVRSGLSYSSLDYMDDWGRLKNVKGINNGNEIALGFASVRSSVIGIETSLGISNFKQKHRQREANFKSSNRIFCRFDINNTWSFKPFLGLNRYKNTKMIYKNNPLVFEYGMSVLYRKKWLSAEFLINSFPEYDHVLEWSNNSNNYRVSSLHLPYFALGVNYILSNKAILNILENEYSIDEYRNLHRGFRVEAGVFNLLPFGGISYEIKRAEDKKARYEIGIRMAYNGFALTDLYFGLKYNWITSERMYYKLNYGGEFGAGIGIDLNDGLMLPFPWIFAFLENEFTRFYIRVGGGVGGYVSLGYKLL